MATVTNKFKVVDISPDDDHPVISDDNLDESEMVTGFSPNTLIKSESVNTALRESTIVASSLIDALIGDNNLIDGNVNLVISPSTVTSDQLKNFFQDRLGTLQGLKRQTLNLSAVDDDNQLVPNKYLYIINDTSDEGITINLSGISNSVFQQFKIFLNKNAPAGNSSNMVSFRGIPQIILSGYINGVKAKPKSDDTLNFEFAANGIYLLTLTVYDINTIYMEVVNQSEEASNNMASPAMNWKTKIILPATQGGTIKGPTLTYNNPNEQTVEWKLSGDTNKRGDLGANSTGDLDLSGQVPSSVNGNYNFIFTNTAYDNSPITYKLPFDSSNFDVDTVIKPVVTINNISLTKEGIIQKNDQPSIRNMTFNKFGENTAEKDGHGGWYRLTASSFHCEWPDNIITTLLRWKIQTSIWYKLWDNSKAEPSSWTEYKGVIYLQPESTTNYNYKAAIIITYTDANNDSITIDGRQKNNWMVSATNVEIPKPSSYLNPIVKGYDSISYNYGNGIIGVSGAIIYNPNKFKANFYVEDYGYEDTKSPRYNITERNGIASTNQSRVMDPGETIKLDMQMANYSDQRMSLYFDDTNTGQNVITGNRKISDDHYKKGFITFEYKRY